MSYSDADFFLQQREVERDWNKPIALALAFHILSFVLAVALPEIMDRKPILDEIMTVDLVSMPEIQAPAPAQNTPPPSVKETKPAEIKKVETAKVKVPIAEVPEAAPVKVTPVKPVSLKPLKRKVRKTDPKKVAAEEARKQRELERQRALARAREQEKRARLAEAEAKDEARRAREALAAMLIQKGAQQPASSARRSTGSGQVQSVVFKNYLAALYDQVQRYWVLPDMKQWDARLETIVILYIRRDGSVTKTFIEKKSKDPFFDQFVMKTIDSAQPLPRIPKLIKEEPLEIGLRFRPGELLSM